MDGNAGAPEVADDLFGDGGEGEEALSDGEGGCGGGVGCPGGEAAEAGDVSRVQAGHSTVHINHRGKRGWIKE